jgi:hypothetical protein
VVEPSGVVPSKRSCPAWTRHDKSVFVFGGYDGLQRMNDFFEFRLGTCRASWAVPRGAMCGHNDVAHNRRMQTRTTGPSSTLAATRRASGTSTHARITESKHYGVGMQRCGRAAASTLTCGASVRSCSQLVLRVRRLQRRSEVE